MLNAGLGLDERQLIDPEGRYPSRELRGVEILAIEILKFLPIAIVERTRDAIQINSGGKKGIIVLVTPGVVEFRLPTVEWRGPHSPVESSTLWKRVELRRRSRRVDWRKLLESALQEREQQFRPCRYCGEEFPPEHRHGDDVCHGCAEQHLGIVH
ncbi:hypothetical protein ABN584_18900 [Gloeocapsa sp. BRSZ]